MTEFMTTGLLISLRNMGGHPGLQGKRSPTHFYHPSTLLTRPNQSLKQQQSQKSILIGILGSWLLRRYFVKNIHNDFGQSKNEWRSAWFLQGSKGVIRRKFSPFSHISHYSEASLYLWILSIEPTSWGQCPIKIRNQCLKCSNVTPIRRWQRTARFYFNQKQDGRRDEAIEFKDEQKKRFVWLVSPGLAN